MPLDWKCDRTNSLQIPHRDLPLQLASKGPYGRDDLNLWLARHSRFCQPYCAGEHWMALLHRVLRLFGHHPRDHLVLVP